MIKISNVLLSLILVGVGAASVVPFIQNTISENEATEIILHEDKVDLLPGQKYSISPLIKTRKGDILTNKVCEYTSSNPNVVSFDDVHKGVFIARSETFEGDKASVTVSYENLSKEFQVEIIKGESHIINLSLDSEGIDGKQRVLRYGENYGISYSTYPLLGNTDGVTVKVLDKNKNPVEGLLEVENHGSFIVRPVGVGCGYVSVEKENEHFNIPFYAKFNEEAINTALDIKNKTYRIDDIEAIKELEVSPHTFAEHVLARKDDSSLNTQSISFAELDLFTGLTKLTIVHDQKVNIRDYQNSNFDIVLQGKEAASNDIYKFYEDDLTLDPNLLNRIYPSSNVANSVLTVVYYFNVNGYDKYEIVNYTDLTGELLGKKDGWDRYHTEANNRYWYYDAFTTEQVYALEDIEVPRIKLYGKFIGEVFNITFIVDGDTYLSENIQYNTRLTQELQESLSPEAVEAHYGNLKFYDWIDEDGNSYDVTSLYIAERNITITGKVRKEFKVTYSLNGGSLTNIPGSDYEHITVNQTFDYLDELKSTRANSKFECWYCNGELINGSTVFTFASDNYDEDTVTIVAKYSGSFTTIDAFNAAQFGDIDIAVLDLTNYSSTAIEIIYIPNELDSLKIIGRANNASINARVNARTRNKPLDLILDNCTFSTSTSSVTCDLSSAGNSPITINLIGNNKITNTSSANAVNAGIISFEGSGTMTIQAGKGAKGISCKNLAVVNATLNVTGGDGSNGLSSSNGSAGGDAIYVTSGMDLVNAKVTAKGGDGGYGGAGNDGATVSGSSVAGQKGGDGGTGGSSGKGIYTGWLHVDGNSFLAAQLCTGGKGGNGGNGSSGTNGADATDRGFWSADSGIDGGNGGNGGNGGKGGKGGNASINIYVASEMTISSTSVVTVYENMPGNGGSGGNGGLGGNGGKGGKKGSWAWGGHDGANGRGGYGGNGGESNGFGTYSVGIVVSNVRLSSFNASMRIVRASSAGTYTSGNKGRGGYNYDASTPVNEAVSGTTYVASRTISDSAYSSYNPTFQG